MPDLDYKRIGALFAMFASDDDAQVGRALDQVDWLLAQGQSSWAKLGQEVAKLSRGNHAPTPAPRHSSVERAPSQWKQDRDDILMVMKRRGDLDDWANNFLDSIHEWAVEQGKSLSQPQRDKLHEQMDKVGL